MEMKRVSGFWVMMATLVAVGCGVMASFSGSAQAQYYRSPDPRYGGVYGSGGGFYSGYFGTQRSPVVRGMADISASYRPGTIVISTSERRLYLVTAPGQAISYGIGVGRIGFTWSGTTAISAKREWPDWTPPSQMLKRRPDLPRHMTGGIDNPLGARAMYLGSSMYRIHGSNEPETIGQAVSSGCFRLTNEDAIDLYNRVHVGTKVVVLR
jgi:lipoprotein-anchoring transpeptidase ErfK/SrfK